MLRGAQAGEDVTALQRRAQGGHPERWLCRCSPVSPHRPRLPYEEGSPSPSSLLSELSRRLGGRVPCLLG